MRTEPRPPGRLLALLALAALAACASPQQGRRTAPTGSAAVQPRVSGGAETVLASEPAAAIAKAGQVLRERGFALVAPPTPNGPLEATNRGAASASWAECPAITLRDPFSEALRARRTEASGFTARVTVSATPLPAGGGTRLAVRALNIGTYVNSFTNTPQQSTCRSTGALERELVEAVQAIT
jgi:hypothetical protein